jgi:N-acetylneuraminate synthase
MKNNKRLFIFEFANNHNGSFDKALEMVDSAKRIANSKYLDFAIKLQYRDLKTFIHKEAKNNNKHIKRFNEAKLSNSEYSKR